MEFEVIIRGLRLSFEIGGVHEDEPHDFQVVMGFVGQVLPVFLQEYGQDQDLFVEWEYDPFHGEDGVCYVSLPTHPREDEWVREPDGKSWKKVPKGTFFQEWVTEAAMAFRR